MCGGLGKAPIVRNGIFEYFKINIDFESLSLRSMTHLIKPKPIWFGTFII